MISTYNLITGFFEGNYPINELPENCAFATENYQLQFIVGKWNESEWIEGATQEEIDVYNKSLVPDKVSAIQFFTQLEFIGITQQMIIDTIEYLFSQGTLTEQQKILALISVMKAVYFERNNMFISLIGQAFNKTEEDLDTIFINASNIQ